MLKAPNRLRRWSDLRAEEFGWWDDVAQWLKEQRAWDPPRVSWQNESLYRVEDARRRLTAARAKALADWAWHHRYEEEARRRALEYAARREAERIWAASPEGKAEAARQKRERAAELERKHLQDLEIRRHRMPGWAEWAAWAWSVGKQPQYRIGQELGGVSPSYIGMAIEDWLYLNLPEVDASWHGECPLFTRQRRLRKHFEGKTEPPRPRPMVPNLEPVPPNAHTPEEHKERNAWIYRQRLSGQSYVAIAERLGMTRGRVHQVCEQAAEVNRRRAMEWPKPKPWRKPQNLGRPIDLGDEVRDVWLEYRLDEPIEDLRGVWL